MVDLPSDLVTPLIDYDFTNASTLTLNGSGRATAINAYQGTIVPALDHHYASMEYRTSGNGLPFVAANRSISAAKGAIWGTDAAFASQSTSWSISCLMVNDLSGSFLPPTGSPLSFLDNLTEDRTLIYNCNYQLGLFIGPLTYWIQPWVVEDKLPHLVTVTKTPTTAKCYVDGLLVGTTSDVDNWLSGMTGFIIGMVTFGGAFSQNGEAGVTHWRWWPRALTASEVVGVVDEWYRARFSTYKSSATLAKPHWILMSNSFGVSVNNDPVTTLDTTDMLNAMVRYFSQTYGATVERYTNLSISGRSTKEMINNFASLYQPFIEQGGPARVVISEGINDLLKNDAGDLTYTRTGASAWQNMIALKNAIVASDAPGVKVFINGVTPLGNQDLLGVPALSQASVTQAWTDLNTLIRANWRNQGFAGYADFATNANLTDTSNATYFQAAGNLHPKPAGYLEMGKTMAAAYYASNSVSPSDIPASAASRGSLYLPATTAGELSSIWRGIP